MRSLLLLALFISLPLSAGIYNRDTATMTGELVKRPLSLATKTDECNCTAGNELGSTNEIFAKGSNITTHYHYPNSKRN